MRTRRGSRVTLAQVANLVGRSAEASHGGGNITGELRCGITGDKDGCAALVQSASKTSVCRYYSRHPLLDGGNKKKSVPRSHWVYASRIWRSNVSRSACRSGPFCRWSRAPLLVSRDHRRYWTIFFFLFFFPLFFSLSLLLHGRKFIAMNISVDVSFCFVFRFDGYSYSFFLFLFFLIGAIIQ